ncbi:1-deoxy-D-xylulose 5-phosphate reductoisomerase [Tahibacter aquaticus]|uniref:1-deoxy-D-xylulose 5-phosphate reductoisomerase n=1 Tax=Tahibacter aquaticus TaxID=520092 RepID=A0A4R6YY03_9GAMM|nr:1-deoxy-D-xylulose-5-phosphate reductoisomerase [Tahibacter aquaticus]TDR43884.1 1-deoxy-D-xylulose 5-phosphate reductoisomerase [Tahibacter aquaticus]
MRNIAVFGATGSIGASTLDVIARHPQHFRARVLAAHRSVEALAELCQRFQPELAIIADPALEADLRTRLLRAGLSTRAASGSDALNEAAAGSLCDTVVAAIVGAAGLESTLAAARAGKRLLLANKESIVMAGPLLLAALAEGGGELLPVDSEHNALFQALPGRAAVRQDSLAAAGVRKLILTASGGPFRGKTRAELGAITPAQAVAHPNWRMGRKISVDSASLMNKGLEVIEAHFLFAAAPDQIDVVVHPQSIVHSLVEYSDGSVLAQLGNPDMRTALCYGLAWPQRLDAGVKPLDLIALARLDFQPPDLDTFRCLGLAYAALRAGGTAPTVLNAANEIAVAAFLDGQLPFLAIAEVIESCLEKIPSEPVANLAQLIQTDLTARDTAQRMMRRLHC